MGELTPSKEYSLFEKTALSIKDGKHLLGLNISRTQTQFSLVSLGSFSSINSQFFPYDPEVSVIGMTNSNQLVLKGFSNSNPQLRGILVSESKTGFDVYEVVIPRSPDKELNTESFLPLPSVRTITHENSAVDSKEMIPNTEGTQAQIGEISFFVALLSAFLAGLILNIMPCVLPVLGLKIVRLSSLASRKDAYSNALFYGLGVLVSFLTLAFITYFLRESGELVGWGFQFQYPAFVFGLYAVVFLFSLSFFGLYTIQPTGGTQLNTLCNKVESSPMRNFLDGILATLLSTPCTAPFLGTAIGFTTTVDTSSIFLIFIAVAFGFMFPIIAVAFSPKLQKLFPKPGEWMHKFKDFLGIVLLGTSLWLLSVLHALDQNLLIPSLIVSFIGYIFLRYTKYSRSFVIIAIILLFVATYSYIHSEGKTEDSNITINSGDDIWKIS